MTVLVLPTRKPGHTVSIETVLIELPYAAFGRTHVEVAHPKTATERRVLRRHGYRYLRRIRGWTRH